MLQLIGFIVALVVSTLFASSAPDGVSGGGPVGIPQPHPSPAIVLPASHKDPTAPH